MARCEGVRLVGGVGVDVLDARVAMATHDPRPRADPPLVVVAVLGDGRTAVIGDRRVGGRREERLDEFDDATHGSVLSDWCGLRRLGDGLLTVRSVEACNGDLRSFWGKAGPDHACLPGVFPEVARNFAGALRAQVTIDLFAQFAPAVFAQVRHDSLPYRT